MGQKVKINRIFFFLSLISFLTPAGELFPIPFLVGEDDEEEEEEEDILEGHKLQIF